MFVGSVEDTSVSRLSFCGMQSSSPCALLLRLLLWLWDKICSTSSSFSETESPACWLHKGEDRKAFPFDAINPNTLPHNARPAQHVNSAKRAGKWLHSPLYQDCSHLIGCWSFPSIWLVPTKPVGRCPVGLTAHMTRWRILQPLLCVSVLKEIPFMFIAPAKNAVENL